MNETIFDLQTDIINLIVKHNLEKGNYAFIFRNGNLMTFNLDQVELPNKEKIKEENKILQEKK